MKIKHFFLSAILCLGIASASAQEGKSLSLEQAVNLALTNSDEAKISNSRVNTAESELQVTKNLQYPDLKISGQYQYLTGAEIDFPAATTSEGSASEPTPTPDVNQLLLAQANMSLPLFSGFKLKNAVKASENNLKAASLNAQNDKEQIALYTIIDYINLYKAQKAIEIIEENLNSANLRVKDFTAMEENGLLARNDLLKAQLQESNIQLSLEEAKKNSNILNYKLNVMLKLPEATKINTQDTNFGNVIPSNLKGMVSRSDLEALTYQEKAAENQIKMAKSKYYPSIALVGGYTNLDLHNALTVNNAINVGVGLSYNLADIFKNESDVKVAQSKAEELQYTIDMVSDKVKLQIENAKQDYKLSLRKYEVYTKSEEQAIENYRILKDKYDNGLVDTNDLLEADIDQLQAKMNLAYANADITQKYYELLTAQGTLTNQFNN
ncbi:Outer membrane protein TolC [Gillisia sp. Hel1_33_143]|uniref:TolC family protein n=1 Tax=Gillisia sp. Hel1_33_143 TaxID=1336796 RepID=UPI00087C7FFD|nr:TolC family protein [Gillisia sp. Hel1_33_143]SDS25816.1 Outer membrane protein TolC [Gillisia sp. Hel1_33_143]